MERTADNTNSEDGSKKSPFDDLGRDELVKKCKGLLAIAQKAKQAKSDLQNEMESFKLKLESCETEKKASEENVKTLQELVDSLTVQKLNYITEIDTAQNKVKVLSGNCKAYEDEVVKFKSELAVKDKKISEVTVQLSALDCEITSLKRQNNRLVEENEQLLSQLTDLEARTEEFNKIGLQQMEQLRLLEERVNTGNTSDVNRNEIEKLSEKIQKLESELQAKTLSEIEYQKKQTVFEDKIKEITLQYESEKDKKEKANIRLRSYKEKILKCAACINQLKNSRFILSKTVKEYSESIPKWQNDIIKASKFLDSQINELSNENYALKMKLQELEKKIIEFTGATKNNANNEDQISKLSLQNQMLQDQLQHLQEQLGKLTEKNTILNTELQDIKPKYKELKNSQLPALDEDNNLLKHQVKELNQKINYLTSTNNEINNLIQDKESKIIKLNESIHSLQQKAQNQNIDAIENLNLQIKALESEKASLVKEKLNARDSVVDLENQNKLLIEQLNKLTNDLQCLNTQYAALNQEKELLEKNAALETQPEICKMKSEMTVLKEQYDLLKKEHENVTDLNGLLKDEVETLKLSLEQPKDDADNLSDLNVSLQTDIVKLETKLAAYKQENASLLAEVKESRLKMKDIESITADYEDVKSKLLSYKTENTELLNEMKEINQVLKERGEAISKLQKAIAEMEKLIETLEKDRDDANQEKDNLQKKVNTLENDLKLAEQNTGKSAEIAKQIVIARDNALKAAEEKDSVIATLKDEIEKLKQQQTQNMDLPNEDMSTSTTSKAEEYSRMKDLDESFEEKYTKLRIFALKLKKKLNESNILRENAEKDKARLEKMISDNISKNSHRDEVDDGAKNNDVPIITKDEVIELEGKVKSLTSDLEASKGIAAELEKLKAELATKTQQLKAELEAHKATKDSLEKVRRDVKKKSVLSLEIEDYERSMKELTTKIEDNKKKMVQMESTIDTQEGTITAMKTQIKLLEEQIKTEETQNRLAKEEIQHAVEEGKEKDNVIRVKNGIISKLELDLEDEKRKYEEVNLEMTKILGEKEKVIISLGEEKLELNNKLKRMEFKAADLEEKLKITKIELEDLKTEYTSYKVRAQSVLRQNQTVDHSQEEQLKEEAAALRAQIESLAAKLSTAQEKCAEVQSAAELERRRCAEATSEAGRAAQRTARLQADLSRLAAQLDSERSQHKLQVSTLSQCYKTQISDLEAKLQKEAEEFKKQLSAVQEKFKSGVTVLDRLNSNDHFMPVIPKEEGSDGEMDINVSMLPREEGEGSEAAPSPPLSKSFLVSGGGGRSPVSLERLLEEGVPEDESLDTSSLALTPEQELADMRRKLQAQQQRVKHVTVLLSESERECARYLQMNDLLKAEVRRARGSLERTQHAHNAEYMKNVTLKFLTLPPGDERSRLVPVLQKILTLTSEETHKINSVAKGTDPNSTKGWGSYLPWPGGK